MKDSDQPIPDNLANSLTSTIAVHQPTTVPELNVYTNMVTSFILVIGLIVALGWLVKRSRLRNLTHRLINVRDSYMINAKDRIIVIEVNQQLLIIGVTAQQMTLLHTINQTDSQALLTEHGITNPTASNSTFYQFLQSALKRNKSCD